jgi:putative oxidoreductase
MSVQQTRSEQRADAVTITALRVMTGVILATHGALKLLGLLTRLAALGTWSSMAVAVGYAHFGHGLLSKNGGWEFPVLLGLVSLFFVTHGGGPASLDALFSRERRQTRAARVSSYA